MIIGRKWLFVLDVIGYCRIPGQWIDISDLFVGGELRRKRNRLLLGLQKREIHSLVYLRKRGDMRQRQEVTGITIKGKTPDGNFYITLNENSDGQGLFEVFLTIGKAGNSVKAAAEVIARLISYILQQEKLKSVANRIDDIAEHLVGIAYGDKSPVFNDPHVKDSFGVVLSPYDFLGKALKKYLGGEFDREWFGVKKKVGKSEKIPKSENNT